MNHDVRLRIECALPARFLQQAVDSGANLYNVRILNRRRLTADCSEASAAILLRLCETYKLNVRILRRRGFHALLRRIRGRWTLALGILLGVCVCIWVLSRIWFIEIGFTGNCAELGSQRQVLRCLDASGVRRGMLRRSVDPDALSKEISAQAGNFSYVGVRADGVYLRIEASPETPVPDLYEISTVRDLAASRAGIVESVFVRSGKACVSAGETVVPGQTLIRGDERGPEETSTPVGALGDVVARCWYEGNARADIETTLPVRTGTRRIENALVLFGRSLPLSRCASFASEEAAVESLPVVGLFLPLEIRRTTHFETRDQTIRTDPALLEKRLALLARAQARLELTSENTQYDVLSEWTDTEIIEQKMRVRAVIEAAVEIAVPREELN